MPSMTGKHLAAAAAGVAMKSIRAATIARHPLSPPILVQFAIGAVHDILGIFSEKPCPPPRPAAHPALIWQATFPQFPSFLPSAFERRTSGRTITIQISAVDRTSIGSTVACKPTCL